MLWSNLVLVCLLLTILKLLFKILSLVYHPILAGHSVHAGELHLEPAHLPGQSQSVLRPPQGPGAEIKGPEAIITPCVQSRAGELRK